VTTYRVFARNQTTGEEFTIWETIDYKLFNHVLASMAAPCIDLSA
jgi:hypothetical protein